MPILPVDALDDPRLADYSGVPDPILLRHRGLFVAESRLVVRELLTHSRLTTRSLLVTQPALDSLRELVEGREALPIYVGSPALLKGVIGYAVHRGSMALGERPAPRTDLELHTLRESTLAAVLEQIGNPDNVGSIFRNAAAFGAGAVITTSNCADPLYRKAIRTSLGATLRLPYAEMPDWPDGLARLESLGYETVGLTLDDGAMPLETFAASAPSRMALVLGSEGSGISDRALATVRHRVRIPMAPGIDSLNVATASGIALYRLSARSRDRT